MSKELYIVKDECTGCAACEQVAPDVFKMTDENIAIITDQNATTPETIQEAIDSCPAECIKWKE